MLVEWLNVDLTSSGLCHSQAVGLLSQNASSLLTDRFHSVFWLGSNSKAFLLWIFLLLQWQPTNKGECLFCLPSQVIHCLLLWFTLTPFLDSAYPSGQHCFSVLFFKVLSCGPKGWKGSVCHGIPASKHRMMVSSGEMLYRPWGQEKMSKTTKYGNTGLEPQLLSWLKQENHKAQENIQVTPWMPISKLKVFLKGGWDGCIWWCACLVHIKPWVHLPIYITKEKKKKCNKFKRGVSAGDRMQHSHAVKVQVWCGIPSVCSEYHW